MKVYRVTSDVNEYQYFLPEREEDEHLLEMDCTQSSSLVSAASICLPADSQTWGLLPVWR
jgi:hypothetical protein